MDHVLRDRWVAKANWRSDDTITVSTGESESRACTAAPGGLVKEANKEKTVSGVESWSSAHLQISGTLVKKHIQKPGNINLVSNWSKDCRFFNVEQKPRAYPVPAFSVILNVRTNTRNWQPRTPARGLWDIHIIRSVLPGLLEGGGRGKRGYNNGLSVIFPYCRGSSERIRCRPSGMADRIFK